MHHDHNSSSRNKTEAAMNKSRKKRIVLQIFSMILISLNMNAAEDPGSGKGCVFMEAESTTSPLNNWVLIEEGHENYVKGASGRTHIEFLGNAREGGPPDSPLEYRFEVEADGNYALIMKTSKRLEGARDDMCNDAYMKMDGDFESSNQLELQHLKTYMKFFQQGGEIDNCWLWSTQVTDAHHNFTHPTYRLKKNSAYTLTVAGRSKRYNIDYIVLYDTEKYSLSEIQEELDAQSTRAAETGLGPKKFDAPKDLLLVQYDCKTDVDDLHSIAAFATILAHPEYAGLNYHAVAGAYGMQGGLYVPPNALFEAAFGPKWSDAHGDFQRAVSEVSGLAKKTLEAGGRIWIAEAGQSDFSAAWIQAIREAGADFDTKNNIHLVQHGAWNEQNTHPDKLRFVQEFTSYHKIPDGNSPGNGTPGYRSESTTDWTEKITNEDLKEVWNLAKELCRQYNGKDGRYNNTAISGGGFDFSDLSEVTWILDINNAENVEQFFKVFGN